MRGMYWWVTGRVQGVSFRAATQEQALKLGLRGTVRNLPDGRVSVYACGDSSALRALETWLVDGGPPAAQVTRIDSEPALEDRKLQSFEISL